MTEPAGPPPAAPLGPGQLARCQKVIWPGTRVVLGEIEGGGFGVWSMAGGQPLASYPQDAGGWNTATHQWLAWERPAPPPQPLAPQRGGLVISTAGVVVLVAAVVVYWFAHAYVYRHCMFKPDLFSWPGACL